MNPRLNKGFTIIELSIAMSFISMLLLAIVITGIQAGKVYNKGVVLESVNQAGRDIGDTLRRDFLQTDARMVVEFGGAMVRGSSELTSSGPDGKPRSNRMCLGRYSYLWNSPEVVSGKILDRGGVVVYEDKPINFVRVADPDARLCKPVGPATGPLPLDLSSSSLGIHSSQITHLLQQRDGDVVVLSVYSLDAKKIVKEENSREGLFKVGYTIGTGETSEINTGDQSCKPPSDIDSNDSFCAINQFETIVRTNG